MVSLFIDYIFVMTLIYSRYLIFSLANKLINKSNYQLIIFLFCFDYMVNISLLSKQNKKTINYKYIH